MAHFTPPPRQTSKAVTDRTADAVWYFLAGRGEIWRQWGKHQETIEVSSGVSLSIPVGTRFQFRNLSDAPPGIPSCDDASFDRRTRGETGPRPLALDNGLTHSIAREQQAGKTASGGAPSGPGSHPLKTPRPAHRWSGIEARLKAKAAGATSGPATMRHHRPQLARALAVVFIAIVAQAAAPATEAPQAILDQHCVACHGPQVQNAGVRLDGLSSNLVRDRRAAETWHDVRNALNRGEMPPPGAPALHTDDRAALLEWLDSALDKAEAAQRQHDGPAVMRRLNRREYQNTMRDLLGLDVDFVKNLPPDEMSPDGFTNNGAALRMSSLRLEHYLATARSALRRAVVTGPAPPVREHFAEQTVIDKVKTQHWSNRLGRTGTFVARVPDFPDEGDFVLRVRARAVMPTGSPFPRMQVSMGYRADTQTPSRTVGEVDVSDSAVREFEFRGRIEEFPIQSRTQSKYPGLLIWVRNAYSDGWPPPAGERVDFEEDGKAKWKMVWPIDSDFPAIVIESVRFEAPVYASWPPAHHRRLIPRSPARRAAERPAAREQLRAFLRRAYRRPVQTADLRPILRFFDTVRPAVGSYEEAMREAMAMALVSPAFLYRIERGKASSSRIDSYELASRLSYFLWSTMPGARLKALADQGRLREPATLRDEALRMLDDPRSQEFVEQFTDQWLDLAGVHRVAINPNYYPDFDPSLKEHMREETRQFFAALLREDASALHFLRSDWAMLNEPMARHYGVRGPRGGIFEQVSLTGSGRLGGLLSQGSILLSNSTGEDSHPVERGVWIRRALLGDPPSPPPPAVPNLDSGDKELALLPLARQLELHRDSEACARCHQGIDPWGLALEEYDAVGLRREAVSRRMGEHVKSHPVDAEATLPDGYRVSGARGLADYLVAHRSRQFSKALVSKLLAYALGRGLELRDQQFVEDLTDRFEQSGHRLKQLCAMIVTSEPFLSR